MTQPPEPRAVFFDLDDTIISHDAGIEDLWQDICERNIRDLRGLDLSALVNAIHESRDWFWGDPERHRIGRLNIFQARRELVLLAFKNLGIDNTETAHKIADTYSTERESLVTLPAGSIPTLKYFRDKGTGMALLTNGASDTQRKKIEKFDLARYFDIILIEGEFGKGKPEKEIFLRALKELGTEPHEVWMVGDDLERDIAGANDTGIHSIWVDWRNTGLPESPPAYPDRIINGISELIIT